MNSRIINLILVTVLLVGFSLLAYPTFSDYWNSFHQSRAIASYAEDNVNIDEERYEEILSRAREWNEWIADGSIVKEKQLTEEENAEYEELLDPLGSGMTEDCQALRITAARKCSSSGTAARRGTPSPCRS